jgi:hypothetical protein
VGASDNGWRTVVGAGGRIVLSAPSAWQAQESQSELGLTTPEGCSLALWPEPIGGLAGLSQTKTLDYMLASAQQDHERQGLSIEVIGKRVWLGESYIWHEVQYVARPPGDCAGCGPSYSIDLAAKVTDEQVIAGRYTCPGDQPPSEEAAQLLQQVIDTVRLGGNGG